MNVDPDRKAKRMAEDIAMMKDVTRWPMPSVLCVKTQPWINKPGEWPVFGYLVASEPLSVYVTDVAGNIVYPIERFDSYEQMAERWSVD